MKRIATGIYIHIPFCIRKCSYCDFLSAPATELTRESYVAALLSELQHEGRQWGEQVSVDTVYIGGGTPSILTAEQIQRIMRQLHQSFPYGTYHEVTLEINPGTAQIECMQTYWKEGINRLSIGLQSTRLEELRWLGRIHTYEDFLHTFHMARACGFQNINVDLMSGLKQQSVESFLDNLKTVVSLQPEHISTYSLIVEEGTPFYETYQDEPVLPVEVDRDIYHATVRFLQEAGYEHYEISNYAKRGYESLHNSSYWEGKPYLGFGLGASSLWGGERYHKEEQLKNYITLANEGGELRRERTVVTRQQQMEEFMFLGLRKTKGVSRQVFAERFQNSMEEVYGSVLKYWNEAGGLILKGDMVVLTSYGVDISNQILADFIQ